MCRGNIVDQMSEPACLTDLVLSEQAALFQCSSHPPFLKSLKQAWVEWIFRTIFNCPWPNSWHIYFLATCILVMSAPNLPCTGRGQVLTPQALRYGKRDLRFPLVSSSARCKKRTASPYLHILVFVEIFLGSFVDSISFLSVSSSSKYQFLIWYG